MRLLEAPSRSNGCEEFLVSRGCGRWDFQAWAITLNELTPEMKWRLPKTDARLRSDVRLFENGYSHQVRWCIVTQICAVHLLTSLSRNAAIGS